MQTLFDAPEPTPTADDGLPPLTGSPKQVPWALKERARLMAGVHTLIRQQRWLIDAHLTAGRKPQADAACLALGRMVNRAGELEQETTARFWIDGRSLSAEALLRGDNPLDAPEGEDFDR